MIPQGPLRIHIDSLPFRGETTGSTGGIIAHIGSGDRGVWRIFLESICQKPWKKSDGLGSPPDLKARMTTGDPTTYSRNLSNLGTLHVWCTYIEGF